MHDVLFAECTKKANPNEVSNQSSSYRCRFWTQESRPEGPLTPECAALIEKGEAGVCARAHIGRIKTAQTRQFTRERTHPVGSAIRCWAFSTFSPPPPPPTYCP